MISRKTIEELIKFKGKILTTITLPTHKKGEDAKQDPIRYKNLLNKAASQLSKKGLKEREIQSYLKEAKELLEKPSFWVHVDQGLVVYISESETKIFQLPYSLEEMAYVNDHILITPLLPMISLQGIYNVLAVSRQNVRLLECTRNECKDITPPDLPKSLKEYYDDMPDAQIQFHTGAAGEKAMFFGHGAGKEDDKAVVEQYLGKIENIVTPLLNKKQLPLVIVGLEENISMYKKANAYGRLIDNVVHSNPDELNESDLQKAGWEKVKSHFLKDLYNAKQAFKDSTDEITSNNLTEIIKSTVMGKTKTLFLASNEFCWGHYDFSQNEVHYSHNSGPDGIDLINWSAIKAIENGSDVYALPKEEMPYKLPAAAIFRY
ncbi:MAG: hypothetical protein ACFCU6_13615 [Balneolaceae bacterium]